MNILSRDVINKSNRKSISGFNTIINLIDHGMNFDPGKTICVQVSTII